MTSLPRLGVVIVAAGSGVRFGDRGKALALLAGRPLLAWSLDLFTALPETREIVVVAAEHTIEACRSLVASIESPVAIVVPGGETRVDSMCAGLSALSDEVSHVAVHDAARPLATQALAHRVLAAAVETGAAIPAVPVRDTVHVVGADGRLASTLDRSILRAAQTPQIARRDWIEAATRRTREPTDEAGMLHAAGYPVTLVEGDPGNLKITWPEDLLLAESLLAVRERTT